MVQGLKEFRNHSNGREPLDIQCCAGTLALLMGLVCSLLEFVAVLLLLLAKLVPGSSTAQLPTYSKLVVVHLPMQHQNLLKGSHMLEKRQANWPSDSRPDLIHNGQNP